MYKNMRSLKLYQCSAPMDTATPVNRPLVRKKKRKQSPPSAPAAVKRARTHVKAADTPQKPKTQDLESAWTLPRDQLVAKVSEFSSDSVAQLSVSFLTDELTSEDVLKRGKFKALVKRAKLCGMVGMLSVEGTEFDFALLNERTVEWLKKEL